MHKTKKNQFYIVQARKIMEYTSSCSNIFRVGLVCYMLLTIASGFVDAFHSIQTEW